MIILFRKTDLGSCIYHKITWYVRLYPKSVRVTVTVLSRVYYLLVGLFANTAIAMAPNDIHIDVLLNQLTAPNTGINTLSSLLKNVIRETRETILSSFLSNGQDPLMLLDVRSNTLAVLYILWVAFELVSVWLIITPAIGLLGLAEVFLILNLLLGLLFKNFVGGLTLNMPVMHLIVVCSLSSSISIIRLVGHLYSHQIGKRDSPSGFALW